MVVGQSMLRLESDEDMGTREQIPAEAEESNKQPGWEAETHVWFHRRQLTGELVKQQNKRRRFKKKNKKKNIQNFKYRYYQKLLKTTTNLNTNFQQQKVHQEFVEVR